MSDMELTPEERERINDEEKALWRGARKALSLSGKRTLAGAGGR
jgi:hypothetical protein